jgi:hypothetical protein
MVDGAFGGAKICGCGSALLSCRHGNTAQLSDAQAARIVVGGEEPPGERPSGRRRRAKLAHVLVLREEQGIPPRRCGYSPTRQATHESRLLRLETRSVGSRLPLRPVTVQRRMALHHGLPGVCGAACLESTTTNRPNLAYFCWHHRIGTTAALTLAIRTPSRAG